MLTQVGGGDDAKATFGGGDFTIDEADDWDSTLNVGESLTIVAKAGSEDGNPVLGVSFLFSTDDNTVLAVTDDGANTGMIEAVGSGTGTVSVTLVGRGIDLEFDIHSLAEVKLVEIDSPADGHFMLVGESVDLEATAYDSDSDKDADNIVMTDLLTFKSSNTAVVTIDGSKAKAVGVGSADITAHVGDVESDAITINVSPTGDTTHRLTFTRIAAASLEITRTVNDPTANNGDGDFYNYTGGNTDTAGQIQFTVHIRTLNADGTATLSDITADTGLSARVQGDDGVILTDLAADATIEPLTGTPGVFTITIGGSGGDATSGALEAPDPDTRVWGDTGNARLIVSYDTGSNYAEDVVLPAVTVVDAE